MNPELEETGSMDICEGCGESIGPTAALLLSPPKAGLVRVHHICGNCYQSLLIGFAPSKIDRGSDWDYLSDVPSPLESDMPSAPKEPKEDATG